MSEWSIDLVLKTSVGASLPWVRIPPLPPCGRSSVVELLVANEKVGGSNPLVRSNGPVVYWLGHVTFTDEKADRNRSGLPDLGTWAGR